jgi:hypothetical protein
VWERLLELAQEHAGGLQMSLVFLDGTNIRAHAKAAAHCLIRNATEWLAVASPDLLPAGVHRRGRAWGGSAWQRVTSWWRRSGGGMPRGSRAERGRILDELAAVTGLHRKHAVRLLRDEQPGQRSGPRPSRRVYDDAVREALVVLWVAIRLRRKRCGADRVEVGLRR